ncbi:MAG TPA: alpha-glucuronidase family glycosyl hydrolase [Terriglobia bacterium]|nr:alpha-glucuronidase family glycosyl hydrolase [Terriglobia bacterium]
MKISRRRFVGTGLAGAAGLYVAGNAQAQQPLPDEDGYKLWLRYAPPPRNAASEYRQAVRGIIVEGASPAAQAARLELTTAIEAMLGTPPSDSRAGVIIAGTPSNSALIRGRGWQSDLAPLGKEGFLIRSTTLDGRNAIAVASEGETGVLYGAFHLLRLMQTGQSIERLNIAERPRLQLRLVNHWDNLDGSIERGYAGRSIWQWSELPGTISPRYADYARAQASIGVNGAAINNVNADARLLSPEYLEKVAALAGVWRPYGVRMYVSINVASPIRLGGLATADPLDKGVADWWKAKAEEIYKIIPDFGGFLVKANSEGQPGPKDYGRTHADGANVLADALAPHGGAVIWRAFIYDEDVDPDRAKRAYLEFTRLDGKFRPNVLVQVKNGAIDFMPREPFHPLFGAMKQTPVLAEVQATQEYLGQAKHLVYLGTMWKEFLDADTYAKGKGSTVGRVLEGAVHSYPVTGMVAVLNTGLDTNWCGHHFSQANWYAAGRLAWNHELSAERIADEWTRMTLTNDNATVEKIRGMMMTSRETYVNYTMPLGLHHLIGGDHYAPMPQNGQAPRSDWTATYYHQASAEGVGFDRSMKGDQAVAQYFPPVRDMFDSLATCPEEFLLWFHHLPWTYRLKSRQTLWDGLVEKYYSGARDAAALAAAWQSLASQIDARRHKEVAARLAIQTGDAAKWRDQILRYFQGFSKLEIKSPGA